MVGSWDRLRPGLARALDAGVPFPPELVPAHFPDDAPLLGAVALAVDAAPEGCTPIPARATGRCAPTAACRTPARTGTLTESLQS